MLLLSILQSRALLIGWSRRIEGASSAASKLHVVEGEVDKLQATVREVTILAQNPQQCHRFPSLHLHPLYPALTTINHGVAATNQKM